MSDQQASSVQPRQSTSASERTRRTRHTPLTKSKATSSRVSKRQNSGMAMSIPSGPSNRPAKRRQSSHVTDNVGANMNDNQSGRPAFTKTGRISKALKGVRIHTCEQCGKVYSRNEHLLHHPSADLESISSRVSSEPHQANCGAVQLPADSIKHEQAEREFSPRPPSSTDSTYTSVEIDFATVYPNSDKGPWIRPQFPPDSSNWADEAFGSSHIFLPPSPAVTSPWPQYNNPSSAPTNIDLSSTFPYTNVLDWSGLNSETNSPPIWEQLYFEPDMTVITGTSRSSSAPVIAVPPQLMPSNSASTSYEDSSQNGPIGQLLSQDRQRIYVEAYWRHFHPIFPILHKQKFTQYRRLPGGSVLLAAIMAIGAQFTHEWFAGSDSRILLERCAEKITKQYQQPSAMPLEIMQAVVLLEYLSHFKAKRAPETLSKLFIGVYDMLWDIHRNEQPRSTIDRLGDVSQTSEESLPRQWMTWIEVHGRERLLSSCYILDSRHALLLSRPNHAAALSGPELYVPIPNALWDAPKPDDWAQMLRTEHLPTTTIFELLDNVDCNVPDINCGPFESALIVGCYASSVTCQINDPNMTFIGPSHSIFEPSRINILSRCLSNHHSIRIMLLAVQLISLTPFRALVATSGKSWFFSKRLAGDASSAAEEYDRLKQQMRTWTEQALPVLSNVNGTQRSPYVQAVSIALQIINEVSTVQNPHLDLAFGCELALYFASLVLWSATFAGISLSARRHSYPTEHDTTDSFDWEPSRAESHVKDFVKLAIADVNEVASTLTPSTTAQPITTHLAEPHILASMPLRTNVSYPPIIIGQSVSSPGTPIVSGLLTPALPILPPTRMLPSWKIGVGAILRWSAWVLGGAGHRNSGAGELIEGAISVLEEVGHTGWVGPWF
ncbi:hypothetical protein BT63DRAFT_416854 [Microthyrium microscopicum]|uniref:C2H2-type domain-containing protein n=1 Tax=Microthyrium microscopicum TaxID=703497 RepID=A0A6A6U2W0_9PEZI|nr:hypothetical protein BT63DRAFT_416854 [Microthyrium microscopicum]